MRRKSLSVNCMKEVLMVGRREFACRNEGVLCVTSGEDGRMGYETFEMITAQYTAVSRKVVQQKCK